MNSAEIRRAFLAFFMEKGHAHVSSSPLVPGNDPTLLFTNSGMVQFKDVFLGREQRPYRRAVTSQRCVRAGGKHNDLENVGYTARHHTFFEMLGNFSFGDYFKREAIAFAWEFLTQRIGIPPEKLWVTVYWTDDEAYDLWRQEIGLPPERVLRIGDKPGGGSDNFWQMGDTGPCGPCTEIFYDHGPEVPGGLPGTPEEDGDRYIEIWNLVFMQYERSAEGQLTPLPNPSVDTGMGLERLAAVLQGVHSNYAIDLFQYLMQAAAAVIGSQIPTTSPSLRVIADHIRSISFLITDGVLPGNEGRGYVLRRIIRRAARHGHQLGCDSAFLYQLVPAMVEVMGDAYPELVAAAPTIREVLLKEENKFLETLEKGVRILEEDLRNLQGRVVPGETIFLLYDTYGFPVDLTGDIARERGLQLDLEGFEVAMQAQRARARAASQFRSETVSGDLEVLAPTEFLGYATLDASATVLTVWRDGAVVEALELGQEGGVILDRTPFYGESGGQVGDRGGLSAPGIRFEVTDTRKREQTHVHLGQVRAGRIVPGMTVEAVVTGPRRAAIQRHHSATHLLHKALRDQLGVHVQQKGSLVDADRLRFDFTHFEPLTPAMLRAIEAQVNREILANVPTDTRIMDMESALHSGAMALFGEKYGDQVRVLTIGSSTELCGGTHVERTGDIGLFRIVGESGVAAGVRRIEAVTGTAAAAWVDRHLDLLEQISDRLRCTKADVLTKVQGLLERTRELEKEREALSRRLLAQTGGDLAALAVDLGPARLLVTRVTTTDAKALREMVDQLKQALQSAVILLAAVTEEGKVVLVAGVTKAQTERWHAGQLVGHVAGLLGGRGGGRPDFAMAGGSDPQALDAALAAVEPWVRERLVQESRA
jgi:alanyl-tRNA synthetase